MSLRPGQTVSHYRLLEEIGQGGMGVVFKALDMTLGRTVALKALPAALAHDPERLQRFQREARAVAAINHPNIVTIHSVEEADGVPFLTMELIEGKTLDALIPKGGMARADLFAVAVPLAEALGAAHDKGIVHRDLKPSNVMLTRDGRVKVLDFGLAKLWRQEESLEASADATRTAEQHRAIVGTLPYMSPEQLQGKEVDHRTDLFSLGVMLYEMATGERPFRGDSSAEVTSSILRDTPQPLDRIRRDLPDLLGRMIRRCLEKDPRQRVQSALDLRNELEELRRETGAPEPGGAAARGGAGARWRTALAVLAVAVVATALALWSHFRVAGTVRAERPAGNGASIAILPFVNMSGDPQNEYFSDGITEELINALVQVKDLRVPARTSVFALKGKKMTVQEIGRELGVDTVLEGSVRKSGETLRITAQLIGAKDGYHLWSERYDRQVKDVFAIQDEIARSIVAALQIRLSPNEQAAIQKAPTADVQAYDYYLRGRRLFHLGGRRNWEAARQMFARAIEIDPRYARAYAGIADTSSFTYMYAESTPQNLEQASSASQKALDLGPDLAEAHTSRALALSLSGQNADADAEFETAIRLDPGLFEAHYFYARSCWTQGKAVEAATEFETASRVRPEDYQSVALLVGVYDKLGRHEDALKASARLIELVRKRLESEPDDVRALYLGAGALVHQGRIDEGLRWAERAVTVDPHDASILYNVACAYSAAGRPRQAIDYLEKALDAGFAQRDWIENDSDLDTLRKEPRFQALVKRLEK